jgi:rRNA maturation protein Nop10
MCNPPNEVLVLDDLDVKLSIQNFLSVSNASEGTYELIRQNTLERYPDSQMLSHYQVEPKIADLSGIVPIVHDMCPNSCAAYTGPWIHLEQCPICGEERYDPYRSTQNKRVAKQTFHTIPIGPQLQALWQSPEGAKAMKYR